ncbi:MAG: PIN domain-containing protein [Spirochaetes bacterium]|nr:PIN domain-containing protein [Spirochaetota bacterium]
MNVYVDTSALYALLDADDGKHRSALGTWEDLLGGRTALHAANCVILETIALLQGRIGLEAVRLFSADILPIITVAWVDEGIHRSTHHALLVAGRRQVSLIDCVSFEVMRRLDLDSAFCFDPHFAEQGFAVVPAA